MKRPGFASGPFLIVFCCAYSVAFAMNWPLFIYYPLHGNFFWGAHMRTGLGPAMVWYGLVASAALAALVAAVLIPENVVQRVLKGYLWAFPLGAMLVCLYLLRHLLFA